MRWSYDGFGRPFQEFWHARLGVWTTPSFSFELVFRVIESRVPGSSKTHPRPESVWGTGALCKGHRDEIRFKKGYRKIHR